jgi:hypothetical protein
MPQDDQLYQECIYNGQPFENNLKTTTTIVSRHKSPSHSNFQLDIRIPIRCTYHLWGSCCCGDLELPDEWVCFLRMEGGRCTDCQEMSFPHRLLQSYVHLHYDDLCALLMAFSRLQPSMPHPNTTRRCSRSETKTPSIFPFAAAQMAHSSLSHPHG